MRNTTHTQTLLMQAILLAILGSVAGCNFSINVDLTLWLGLASADFTITEDFSGVSTVVVTTENGDISVDVENTVTEAVIAGTRRATGIDDEDAEARLPEVEIKVQRNADDSSILEITAILPKVSGTVRGSVDFKISLPSGASLKLNSTNGDIDVEDNTGAVVASTTNGDVTIDDNIGSVAAQSTNGYMLLTDVTGNVTFVTTNGDVVASGILGSVSGTTTNGDVNVKATITGKQRIDVETSNGRIDIKAPDDIAVDLDLATSTLSRVTAELGAFIVTDLSISDSSITATLNGGGGQIKARTTIGRITFNTF